jgi:hypothetical protein
MKVLLKLIVSALLESIRIILLFSIVGGFFSQLLMKVYISFSTDVTSYGWIGSVAILILFIVLYRNKLQFSGWYKGKKGRLPKTVTQILVFGACLLLFLPPILSYVMN